jgi:hypothetical protein
MRGDGADSDAVSRTEGIKLRVRFDSLAALRRTTAHGALYEELTPNETLYPGTVSACQLRAFPLWWF